VEEAGAAAISLGAPRGSLPVNETFMHGRVYGPAVFPLGLQMTAELYAMGIPVIGAGGVYERQQVDEMRRAGALAVQVDLALWRGDWMELQEEELP
jgi:dihydroorotate dehydrogenase